MCHESVLAFGQSALQAADLLDARVLEVGSLNVNGSLRQYVETHGARSYVGVDLVIGSGVDRLCSAEHLVAEFGRESFDLVLCTEMLEHCRAWQRAVSQMKRVLIPGGVLLLTTRSVGFAKHHEHPGDFWRFSVADMAAIFSDMLIHACIPDPGGSGGGPGVFVKASKPSRFVERDLTEYTVHAMEA